MSSLAQAPARGAPRASRAGDASLRLELVVLALLTLLAFVLRVSQLHQSLLGDEAFTWQDIHRHSLRAVISTVHTGGENSPPLFFVLAWAAAHFGNDSVWIRVPSFVLGSATVPVVYAIGRQVHGRVAGLIAAGLLAIAPFAVFYGIEARPYGTMMFFVALSTLAVLRATRTGRRGWWLLYTLAAAAAAYSHYTAIFALGAQTLWSLWRCRARIAPALIANVAIVVLYLPWLPHLRGKALAVIGFLYPLGVQRVLTDLLRPIPGHPAAPLHAIPTVAGEVVFAAVVLGGVMAISRRAGRPSSERVLLALLVLATPAGLLLYSLTVTDLWLPRGLSASLPAAAIALGALSAALPRRVIPVAALAMAITLLAGTVRSYGSAYARGPFRTIAAYLDRTAAPRTPVLIVSIVGEPAVQAQLQKPHLYETALAAVWPATPPGGVAFVGLDTSLLDSGRLFVPHHPGFRIIAHRHFGGAYAVDLYEYRRTG